MLPERLAEMGTYFTNAHCNYPRCVQSRSSYMTGLYPETFIGRNVPGAVNGHDIKDAQGVVEQAEALDTKVMESYFKDHGYKTYMIGKIYHGRAHDGIDVDGGSAGRPAGSPKFKGKGTGAELEALTVPRPWMRLDLEITGQGNMSRNPPGPTYEESEVVTLTAEPAPGWRFDRWARHASGTDLKTTVTMKPYHRTVEAHFVEE